MSNVEGNTNESTAVDSRDQGTQEVSQNDAPLAEQNAQDQEGVKEVFEKVEGCWPKDWSEFRERDAALGLSKRCARINHGSAHVAKLLV